jgi:hypothetical protein
MFKVPADSFPPITTVPLSEVPPLPLPSEWGALNAIGKRTYSVQEQQWMANVIEWCLTKCPGMNLTAVCELLGLVVSNSLPNVIVRRR